MKRKSKEKAEESRDSEERKVRKRTKRRKGPSEKQEEEEGGERKNPAEEEEEEGEEEDQEEGEKRKKEERAGTPSFGRGVSKGPPGRVAWGGRGNGKDGERCDVGIGTLGRRRRGRGRRDGDIPPGNESGPSVAERAPFAGHEGDHAPSYQSPAAVTRGWGWHRGCR